MEADPPVDEAPSSPHPVVREVVVRLKEGKAAGICNIYAKLLKPGGMAVTCGLHAVLPID